MFGWPEGQGHGERDHRERQGSERQQPHRSEQQQPEVAGAVPDRFGGPVLPLCLPVDLGGSVRQVPGVAGDRMGEQALQVSEGPQQRQAE
ncbi:hypothetical protein AB0942_12195 [Streptomyces nodosus]|uniref:hypothetical protein n=1 Tax=Streptomyces nodosus TaxID=40318 RepID=UPI00345218F8